MSIYIGIGANIPSPFGNPYQSIQHLIAILPSHGITVIRQARCWRNPAWPDPNDPEFLNTCIEVNTSLSPDDLLKTLLKIEEQFDRTRTHKNAPRPLDLDIIDYNGEKIEQDNLSLPHPKLQERAFVLLPLFDIAPLWQHPTIKIPIHELLRNLDQEDHEKTIPLCHTYHPFKEGPILMGILNVTPDSFHDGGAYNRIDRAVDRARKMIEDGANIIDIGGESTRPGAKPVTVEEEIGRTVPIIAILADEARDKGIYISIDTRNAKTMSEAIKAGATMINDVSALTHDPDSIKVAANFDGPVCLMHMQGLPENMQNSPTYNNVVYDVKNYLAERINACLKANISSNRIVVDPGIGFGKTLEQNLELLKKMSAFQDLGTPILLGASRKGFIEKICPGTISEQRLPGSLVVATNSVRKGVQIIRTHDVAETKQALDVLSAIR